MQRQPSHYVKKSFGALLAAAAGLVTGMLVETTHLSQWEPESYFVTQERAL